MNEKNETDVESKNGNHMHCVYMLSTTDTFNSCLMASKTTMQCNAMRCSTHTLKQLFFFHYFAHAKTLNKKWIKYVMCLREAWHQHFSCEYYFEPIYNCTRNCRYNTIMERVNFFAFFSSIRFLFLHIMLCVCVCVWFKLQQTAATAKH